MRTTRKIGLNRGNPRLWLEGSLLASEGWRQGDRFDAIFGDGSITYRKNPEGQRGVAGTAGRPIIDTNTPKITNALGAVPEVSVVVETDLITITPK